MSKKLSAKDYWYANLKILSVLLSIWFAVSLGCGVLLAPWLNQFKWAGFKVGFWFAQQGAILFFLVIIFVYIILMNRLESNISVEDSNK